MKKRIFSLVTLISFVLCLMVISPIMVNADSFKEDYYTYTVSNDVATITACDTSISGDITIPSTLGGYPVTSIGEEAFYGCTSLTSITIPDNVTSIGSRTFIYCINLSSITIPDSVTNIGYSAFSYCESLTNITIPDSVTNIGYSAFSYCESLTNITIPDSVTNIGGGAFENCSGLSSITIPDSVTRIESSTFEYCTNLTSITIPNGVTNIGYRAFAYCESLTSITIPDSVKSIGDRAFANCSSFTSITIPDSVISIGFEAFYYCTNLTNITIPDNVTNIGESAFYGTRYYNNSSNWKNNVLHIGKHLIKAHSSISGEYTVKNSIISINDTAFADCGNLTSVTISDSVTSIGNLAFYKCISLTNITIPDSVTSIGNTAFADCSNLSSINVSGNNQYYTSVDGVLFDKDKTFLIGYPIGKTNANYITPDSVTRIGEAAFRDCSNLRSITIYDSVTSIDNSAFYDCNSLTDVYYTGTEEEWNKISIGRNNFALTNATKHYNYDPNPSIVLSKTEITALPYTCQSIYVYKEDGVTPYDKSFKVKVTSNKPNIVSTSRKGAEIELSFNAIGEAIITVEATDGSGKKATCKVVVTKQIGSEERDLLERLALCQIVYSNNNRETDGGYKAYDLVVGKTVGQQKANKKGEMFYHYRDDTVTYEKFYKQYINDYKVIKLPENPTRGFYAAAFENTDTGEIIIAYRGSEGENGGLGMFDFFDKKEVDWWGTNLPMSVFGVLSSQFTQALNFYKEVRNADENKGKIITLTGHSLGGALASYVAINCNVKCNNINGATGWIYNNNFMMNPDNYLVNYKGTDQYVNENFNNHDDTSNNAVTRWANLGAFNYSEYEDSINYNSLDVRIGYVLGIITNETVLSNDYHKISSIINYDNGLFSLTKKTKQHTALSPLKGTDHYIGTSENNIYVAPLTKKNYAENLPGGSPSSYKKLPVVPTNQYILSGDGDDNITLPEGGNDTLIGNAGNDTLNGGAGNDIYVYGGDFGNDTIIDPSGNDKIEFTDRTLSEITISGTNITCGSNSIEISTKSKRTADFTVVDKDKNTKTIKMPKISLYSLESETTNETTKGIKIFGNSEVEIYDSEEELIETIYISEDTETSVDYRDYGMIAYSPQAIGLTLSSDGYIVKVKSDETVSVWTVSDSDNITVAKQTFIENQNLSDGSIIVINTGEMVEEQLSVKLLSGEEEKNMYSELPGNFTITADKTTIKTGETITMSVPETFADSVVWECDNNNVIISKNEDLSVSVIGYMPGEENVRAYLPNDELYFADISIEITEDSSPGVFISSEEEVYDGTEIANDSVFFDITMTDGYDMVVFDTLSPYSQIEDTNTFAVNSCGNHIINIYCKNSETGARTKSFTFEFSQDSEVPEISGVENEAVYYTDRVINISDTSLDTIYVNDKLYEEETFILSEVGVHNIIATDTAGNTTELSFEIKALPSASDLSISDALIVPKIRSDFEENKYSLSEDRMNEVEYLISALEAEVVEMCIVTVYEDDTATLMTKDDFCNYSPKEKEDFIFVGWYDNAEFTGEPISFPYSGTKTTFYAKWKPIIKTITTLLSKTPEYDIYSVNTVNIPIGSTMIFACYNDKKLVYSEIRIYNGENPVYFVEFGKDDYNSVKVIVWEDTESLKPICESEKVIINNP